MTQTPDAPAPEAGPASLHPHIAAVTRTATRAASELKAEELRVVDLSGRSSYCDAVVICGATTARQVRAIAESVVRAARQAGHSLLGVEGLEVGRWVLIDLGDVVVHVFEGPWRGYYDLDGIFVDARAVRMDELGLTDEGLAPAAEAPAEGPPPAGGAEPA
jgi:ribosome-associated protein